jgi:hypothetical protein
VQVHGGALKICDANTAVKRVMEVSGVSRLLKLYDTEKEALAAFVDEQQHELASRIDCIENHLAEASEYQPRGVA